MKQQNKGHQGLSGASGEVTIGSLATSKRRTEHIHILSRADNYQKHCIHNLKKVNLLKAYY
jgi:hypothetical protein